jgi:hypothetical protein
VALWSAFYPDVLVYVPGCPDPTVDQALRDASIEFFRRTRAWMEWLEPIFTAGALREYELELPTGAEVVRIERATRNGQPLEVQGFRTLAADPARTAGGDLALVSADRVAVLLTQAVAPKERVQVQASLRPTATAAGLGDTLFGQHRQAIAEGAKHRLLRMPGPLHKPREAEEARLLFEAAVARAGVDSWRSHTNATPRAQPKWC